MADDEKQQKTPEAPQRTWTVPTLRSDVDGALVPDIDQAISAATEIAVILMRMGGGVSIAAKRVKLDGAGRFPDRYETELLVIRHVSMPIPTTPKPAPPPAEDDAE